MIAKLVKFLVEKLKSQGRVVLLLLVWCHDLLALSLRLDGLVLGVVGPEALSRYLGLGIKLI